MKVLTVTAQPKPVEGWVHRFRNFGEEVYVRLRSSCEVDIAEIDASFDEFHLRQIPAEAVDEIARAVTDLNRAHQLDDSVFVRVHDAPVERRTVIVVLDSEFGERLWEIAGRHPVWIAGSEANRAAAGHVTDADVTTWTNELALVTEQQWSGVLNTLDLHHGDLASDPPMNKLLVYGAPVTPPAVVAFAEYGFETVIATASGFMALQE